MSAPQKPSLLSRRSLLRLVAAIPLFSIFGLAPSASREFIEVDGWILKRSDLRRRRRP